VKLVMSSAQNLLVTGEMQKQIGLRDKGKNKMNSEKKSCTKIKKLSKRLKIINSIQENLTNNHVYCRSFDLEKLGEHVYICKVCKTTYKVLEDENKKAVGVKVLKNETRT